jgi:hypothetical protein
MDRIRRSQMTHVADAEDLITYAKEIVALRTLIQPTPAETEPVAWHWEASDGQSAWPVWVMQAERPKHAPASAVPLYSEAQVSTLSRHLEEAREALEQGFMTANSDGQTGRYEVVIKFRDIKAMQAAHGALVNFARRAKETVSHG